VTALMFLRQSVCDLATMCNFAIAGGKQLLNVLVLLSHDDPLHAACDALAGAGNVAGKNPLKRNG
jgi:hypothetical protein